MSRTINVQVYKFDELDDRAKERARDGYRRATADDSFWQESVTEDIAFAANRLGMDIRTRTVRLAGGGTRGEPNIQWSEREGASVCGDWRASRMLAADKNVRDEFPTESALHDIDVELRALALRYPEAAASLDHAFGRTINQRTEFVSNAEYPDEATAHEKLCIETEEEEAASAFKEAARDFAHWAAQRLEREWEYQNSDECVDENIRCNEYEFTADGEVY